MHMQKDYEAYKTFHFYGRQLLFFLKYLIMQFVFQSLFFLGL